MMDFGEGGDGPEIKRRKAFTKRETLQRLEELGDNVSKAVSEMVSDLSPFDVNGENVTAYEDHIEKLDKVASSLTSKIYRLKSDVKAQKFRRKDDLLDENIISVSQHSVLQSQEFDEDLSRSFSQQSLHDIPAGCPGTYRLVFKELLSSR